MRGGVSGRGRADRGLARGVAQQLDRGAARAAGELLAAIDA